jgi:two-component system LytT family response regulator
MIEYCCLIFDDEPSAIVEVSFLIGKFAPNWKIKGIASDIETCKKLLETQNPDVIFSDIHFGKDLIFDIIPELKSFKGDIVFISGDNGFASEAFQLSAANYFLKPINELQFKTFIDKFSVNPLKKGNESFAEVLFHNLIEPQNALKKIAFSTNTGYIIKELSTVVYAKAISNYTEFYFEDRDKLLTTKTLLIFEKMLESFGFFRIHQSYLVNFKFVTKFDSEDLQLYLSNGEVLPVSNRRKSQLLELLKGIF